MADIGKRSKVTNEKGAYRKELVGPDGEIKVFEYTHNPKTKTVVQQLNDTPDKQQETLAEWKKDAKRILSGGDWKKQLSKQIGSYVKYELYNSKNKKTLIRPGGVIMKVEDKYVMLKNTVTNGAWSVQYQHPKNNFDLVNVFVMRETKKNSSVPEEEVSTEIEKKAEKVKEVIEEEEEKAKPEKQKRLTNDEAEAVLKENYYEKDMKFGRDKLYATMKADGYLISRVQVDGFLKKQKLYQLEKTVFEPKDFVIQTATDVNKVWNIDLVEMDGDKIVLNCVDRFSKYARSRILRNKTAIQVVNALQSIFKGVKPSSIVSDNGPEFKSVVTDKYLKSVDVKQVFSSPHQPQSNGLVERFNRTMKDMFKKMTYQTAEDKVVFTQVILNRILKAYNNSVHSTIGMKPADALKADNKEEVSKMNNKHLSVSNKKQKNDLEKGSQVRISLNKGADKTTKKHRTNWSEEVYTVVKVVRGKDPLKPIQYKVEDGDGEKVRGLFKREQVQKIDYVENEDKVDVPYTVERFVKEEGNKILVSWKGYKADQNTYQTKKMLKSDLGKDKYDELYADMKK